MKCCASLFMTVKRSKNRANEKGSFRLACGQSCIRWLVHLVARFFGLNRLDPCKISIATSCFSTQLFQIILSMNIVHNILTILS